MGDKVSDRQCVADTVPIVFAAKIFDLLHSFFVGNISFLHHNDRVGGIIW